MTSISDLLTNSGKILSRNSPAILAAAGVTGVIGTAYLAAKGSFKAARVLAEEPEELTPREKSRNYLALLRSCHDLWRWYYWRNSLLP